MDLSISRTRAGWPQVLPIVQALKACISRTRGGDSWTIDHKNESAGFPTYASSIRGADPLL